MLDKVLTFLSVGQLPGECWKITAYEAHCMLMALERLGQYFNNEDMDFLIWQKTLQVETQKYTLREFREVTTHKEIIPHDHDRIFFEVLLKAERARLAEMPPDTPCYDCGGTVYDHENTLREWLDREIEPFKLFARSRRRLDELSTQHKMRGIKCLAREDAEKIVEIELARIKPRLIAGDPKILEELKQLLGDNLDKEQTLMDMRRAHQATLEGCRKQLWALLENYILTD